MQKNYEIYETTSNTLLCGANNVKFLSVDGFTVFDAKNRQCNCGCMGCPPCNSVVNATPVDCRYNSTMIFPLGTLFGSCRGTNDTVTVQFELFIDVGPVYDVGLYVNLNGGDGEYASQRRRRGMAVCCGCCRRLIIFTF
jgi:hypothetical protein